MTVRFDVKLGFATHVGSTRKENQDRCGWFELIDPPGYVILVADGMGGHSGGAVAAQIAFNAVRKVLLRPFTDPSIAIREAFASVADSLQTTASRQPRLKTMGTTLSLALYTGGFLFPAHIGDSRIYRINPRGIRQISEDHSMVQEMVRQGLITSEEARCRTDDNVLTKALTASQFDEPDFYDALEIKAGDCILVCSDGLWKMASDEEIFAAVNDRKAQDAADELVRRANANGGEDNIAVGVMQFDIA